MCIMLYEGYYCILKYNKEHVTPQETPLSGGRVDEEHTLLRVWESASL